MQTVAKLSDMQNFAYKKNILWIPLSLIRIWIREARANHRGPRSLLFEPRAWHKAYMLQKHRKKRNWRGKVDDFVLTLLTQKLTRTCKMIKSTEGSMLPLTSWPLQLKKSPGSFLDLCDTSSRPKWQVGDVCCVNFPSGVRATPNMCRVTSGSIGSCRKISISENVQVYNSWIKIQRFSSSFFQLFKF